MSATVHHPLALSPSPSLSPSAVAEPSAQRWTGLPPVVSAQTRVLVLGSFPGAASLAGGQYYAHPQNQFWKILQALWPHATLPPSGPAHYAARCAWLLARGLGLWDVYASCERVGSLDARIRQPTLNDFVRLRDQCPQLVGLAHNGAASFRHAPEVLACLQRPGGGPRQLPVIATRLPSTSPAHASWPLERKVTAWAAVMKEHGLL